MSYLLDTTILVGLLQAAPYADYASKKYALWEISSAPIISVVTVAEIRSFSLRRQWGAERMERIEDLFRKIPQVPCNHPSVINKWAEIDAYNHRKHPTLQLEGSARTMGDNDLWIAATASVLRARLLTTDKDFSHLDGVFAEVDCIDTSWTASDV
ncbi:MAG: type II toxin-antitoxin system VapC family toxin [Candidatus Hydrogenedentes bacterium]|nr:type II toxin-antitoxin system VapC family toxin [Candidatus Hydrogenedentota bacterium]